MTLIKREERKTKKLKPQRFMNNSKTSKIRKTCFFINRLTC